MAATSLLIVTAATTLGILFGPGVAQAHGGCPGNLVPRNAGPPDNVCVRARVAVVVAQENSNAASLVEPGGGAYGPQTCKQGYVWREAFDGDTVCVTPERRSETLAQNADAPKVGADAPVAPPAGNPGQPPPPSPTDCFMDICIR